MRSSLAGLESKQPLSRPEVQAELAKAWLEHGIAVLPLRQIDDQAERDCITRIAERLYGKA